MSHGNRKTYREWLEPSSTRKKPKTTEWRLSNLQDGSTSSQEPSNPTLSEALSSNQENQNQMPSHSSTLEGISNLDRPESQQSMGGCSERITGSDSSSSESNGESDEESNFQNTSSPSPSESNGESDEDDDDDDDDDDDFLSKLQKLIDKYKLHTEVVSQSNLTRFEILVAMYHYCVRYGLTGVATESLIELVNFILGSSVIPASRHIFEKVFPPADISTFHLYCPNCHLYLGPQADVKANNVRKCPSCQHTINWKTTGTTNFFVSLSVEKQIKTRLEADGDQIIQFRRNRPQDPNIISDMFECVVFSDLKDAGLRDDDITVTMSADSAPVFKSNNNGLLPIQLRINEIDPKERFSSHNLIVAGLWFGKGELSLPSFVIPFMTEMKHLYQHGIEWLSPTKNDLITTKVFLSHCAMDSVAKPKLMCMKQFNGADSCYFCYHPGVQTDVGLRFNADAEVEERTNESIRNDMKEAFEVDQVTKGAKSISPLTGLPYFDMTYSITIDYLHSHLLGVVKYLAVNLWMNTTLHDRPFYLTQDKIKRIDARLLSLRPPSDISRDTRPLSDCVKWKGNEWRAWLFFYGPICLKDILPALYHRHFCLLSSCLFLLNGDKILRDDLETISDNLDQFVIQFENHYGLDAMVFNVHLTKHLVKLVIFAGPLWTHSLFPYEGGNGFLVSLVKGGRGVLQQVTRQYSTFYNLPKTLSYHPPLKECVLDYCTSIMTFTRFKKYSRSQNVTIIGNQFKNYFIPNEEEAEIIQQMGIDFEKLYLVKKIIFRSTRFSVEKIEEVELEDGTIAQQETRRNDSIVMLENGAFAKIEKFFISDIEIETVYAVIKTIVIDKMLHQGFKSHVHVCRSYMFDDHLSVVDVRSFARKCLLISHDVANHYIFCFPNTFEKD